MTFFVPLSFLTVLAVLVQWAQSQILGSDCKWWLEINHTWITALRCQPLKYSQAPEYIWDDWKSAMLQDPTGLRNANVFSWTSDVQLCSNSCRDVFPPKPQSISEGTRAAWARNIFKAALPRGWENHYSQRDDRTSPAEETGFRCLQIIRWPWLKTRLCHEGQTWWPQITAANSQLKSQLKSVLHLITSHKLSWTA